MSTRKRNNLSNPNIAAMSDLPPTRKGKATAKHKTNLPFSRVSFKSFIYILSALAFSYIAFNVWRILQWKSAAGGWWNLTIGKRPPAAGHGHGGHTYDAGRASAKGGDENRHSVEDRIDALAEALGLPSRDLASAIADAVRNHVPPASLSSVAAAETGTAAKILAGGEKEEESGTGIADKLGAVAGFDDGPIMD